MKLNRSTFHRWVKLARREFRDKRRKIYWHFRHGIAIKVAPAYFPPERYCPICGKFSLYFLPESIIGKLLFHYLPDGRFKETICPYCSSAARQRLFWHYIHKNWCPPPRRVLHIGPGGILHLISKMKILFGDGYVSVDLLHPAAMVQMDISNLAFPSEVFDLVYCSHVLEHVEGDDSKAMRECRRVLRFGGRAIFQVPLTSQNTFEDWTITDPSERRKVFGRKDHVRIYGPDFHDRLSDSGFQVETFRVGDVMEKGEAKRMGLADRADEEILFVCRR